MDILLTIFRLLMAVAAPLAIIILTALTAIRLRGTAGAPAAEGKSCLRCGKHQPGGEGQFHYTKPIGNARERASQKQFSANPILGSESHFVCDHCAHRFLRGEMLQHLLLALPYPIYLFILQPLVAPAGFLTGFLFETLMVMLSLSGVIAALDLYRAVPQMDEARDRVAIGERRKMLGTKLSYYTRRGKKQIGS